MIYLIEVELQNNLLLKVGYCPEEDQSDLDRLLLVYKDKGIRYNVLCKIQGLPLKIFWLLRRVLWKHVFNPSKLGWFNHCPEVLEFFEDPMFIHRNVIKYYDEDALSRLPLDSDTLTLPNAAKIWIDNLFPEYTDRPSKGSNLKKILESKSIPKDEFEERGKSILGEQPFYDIQYYYSKWSSPTKRIQTLSEIFFYREPNEYANALCMFDDMDEIYRLYLSAGPYECEAKCYHIETIQDDVENDTLFNRQGVTNYVYSILKEGKAYRKKDVRKIIQGAYDKFGYEYKKATSSHVKQWFDAKSIKKVLEFGGWPEDIFILNKKYGEWRRVYL